MRVMETQERTQGLNDVRKSATHNDLVQHQPHGYSMLF